MADAGRLCHSEDYPLLSMREPCPVMEWSGRAPDPLTDFRKVRAKFVGLYAANNAWPSLLTVSAVGIAAPDICVRSFSVAVWSKLLTQIAQRISPHRMRRLTDSNEPALICVRISERHNYNLFE